MPWKKCIIKVKLKKVHDGQVDLKETNDVSHTSKI